MRKATLLFCLLFCSLAAYSQICEDLYDEYYRLEAQYKTLRTTYQKKACVRQMENVIRWGKEANCGFPKRWIQEVRERKQLLYPSSFFEQNEYLFGATGEEVVIGVKISSDVKLVSYPSWMEFIGNEENTGYLFSLQENYSVYERKGVVEVEKGGKTHKCMVTQEPASLIANVTEHVGFGKDGGEGFIYVETNDTTWTFSGDASWFQTELTDEGVKVVCPKNPNRNKRTAKIKVRFACGETRIVEIEQSTVRPVLTIPQKFVSFNNNGGKNDRIVVKCNYDQWTATSSDKWIHVRRKFDGISIECDPNIGSQRVGTVKIETKGVERVTENITVVQAEAASFLYTDKSKYSSDGKATVLFIPVKTNIPDWNCKVEEGDDWTKVEKIEGGVNVNLARNDLNSSRTSVVRLFGQDHNFTLSVTQPNRGYAGRCYDYFESHGTWRLTWVSVDLHGMTTLGNRFSFVNARWKFAELSLIGLNLDYFMEGMVGLSWEPIARGYMPITRDGKWAAYLGMGAHISMTGGFNYFLLEVGAEIQWNEKYSSHIFFKYNGECSFGMSFDFGKWYK